MFSAHLLFGDLNGHSAMPFETRVSALQRFWQVCDELKPQGIGDSQCSFFDIDNDNIMAGFSNLSSMRSGTDVLKWALTLHRRLSNDRIDISFGADLMALCKPLEWPTDRGFIEDTRRLFVPDSFVEKRSSVPRSRIIGDALIVTARLLKLAKAAKCVVAFSSFQGGHLETNMEGLPRYLGHFKIEILNLSSSYHVLGDKATDLLSRNVESYGIRIKA